MTEPVLCLSREDMETMLDFDSVLPIIEDGFSQQAAGRVVTFPAVRVGLQEFDSVFGIKSGFVNKTSTLGLKAGGYWGKRVAAGKPGHFSTIVLFDPSDGRPLAIMDGNYITELRTAAAGAIAAKHLSRSDVDGLAVGLIGSGVQGRSQIKGLLRVLKVARVQVFDIDRKASETVAGDLRKEGVSALSVATPQEAVANADVILTTTPSKKAIVLDDWITPGMHINAMGADTRGKQELDTNILCRATVVVDDRRQAGELGEWQHMVAAGLADKHPIYAELGEITAGIKPGRTDNREITVFDGTGVSFQDLATARYAMDLARARNMGQIVNL